VFIMNLTARGVPLRAKGETEMEGAFAFFLLGREWIVKGFRDLTTDSMHKAWRIIDGG
jgi:hypothetical protein